MGFLDALHLAPTLPVKAGFGSAQVFKMISIPGVGTVKEFSDSAILPAKLPGEIQSVNPESGRVIYVSAAQLKALDSVRADMEQARADKLTAARGGTVQSFLRDLPVVQSVQHGGVIGLVENVGAGVQPKDISPSDSAKKLRKIFLYGGVAIGVIVLAWGLFAIKRFSPNRS